MLYHVESVIILHSSGALMNFFTQQRYKFLNYNQSQTSRVCHFIFCWNGVLYAVSHLRVVYV